MPEKQGFLEELKKFEHPQNVVKSNNSEALPLTPISEDAKYRLHNWGVPDEFIEGLQIILSGFRYDMCKEKAQRIVETEALLHKSKSGKTEEVILPFFYNLGSRADGQCSDIAFGSIYQLQQSGYLEELNNYLREQGRRPIRAGVATGYSRTHFNNGEANHVWMGLLPEGEPDEKMIVADGSFQEVDTLEEIGYKVDKFYNNVQKINNKNLAARVPIGVYERDIKSEKETIEHEKRVVLGISADKAFAYSLGFARDSKTNFICPYIVIIRAESDQHSLAIIKKTGRIEWYNRLDDLKESVNEVEEMLDILRELRIVDEPKIAKEVRNNTVNLRLRKKRHYK